jgi:TatD DNase family protein
MRFHDAHNHLHDERFRGRQEELVDACRAEGVVKMVVNGSCAEDWPQVAALAGRFPDLVIPSFGYHPWYVAERTPDWQQTLTGFLDSTPRAAVGELGLDRWRPGLVYSGQEEVFVWQLRLAAERDLPASIHCLQAWGRLFELLRQHPRPRCGFLLHSYGGPAEMVAPLAKLGAYFGFPGYFMHARKARQREVFLRVPSDRLLIETDAPDQPLPVEEGRGPRDEAEIVRDSAAPAPGQAGGVSPPRHTFTDPATGQPLNHPANLAAIYRFVARMFNESVEELAARVEENFRRVFGEP